MALENAGLPHSALPHHSPNPVLIVDDEQIILDLLRAVLEEEGFTVLTATNGKEALQVVQQTPIALVLTDLMMPEVTGIELARQLHDNPATASIPLVLMSAALPYQIDDLFVFVLQKPFLIEEVVTNVSHWVLRPGS